MVVTQRGGQGEGVVNGAEGLVGYLTVGVKGTSDGALDGRQGGDVVTNNRHVTHTSGVNQQVTHGLGDTAGVYLGGSAVGGTVQTQRHY